MAANELSFNQISAEMNAIHAQAIGIEPPRAINTGAVMTQAQAALLGADVQLVPLAATENGTYNPPAGKGFGTVTVNVPNPNSVETIIGTVANPWGNVNPAELAAEIAANNANAIAVWDATAIGLGESSAPLFLSNDLEYIYIRSARIGTSSDYDALDVAWSTVTGALNEAAVLTSSIGYMDIREYASAITTTITIIHHPIPENNT